MIFYHSPDSLLLIIADLLSVLVVLILIEVVVSWLTVMGSISRYQPWIKTLHKICDPILAPFRKLAPPHKMGGFDISPMLAIILITVIQNILVSAAPVNRLP